MPNARVDSPTPNARIGYGVPNARVSSFQTGISAAGVTTSLMPGMPIGLLLALTYATDMSTTSAPTYRGDTRPNVRIKSV